MKAGHKITIYEEDPLTYSPCHTVFYKV